MSTFIIEIELNKLQEATVRNFMQGFKKQHPKAEIEIKKEIIPQSRSDRFQGCKSMIDNAKSEAEELRDELQTWLDNLPENLQDGGKASELQEAIDNLETFISACEDTEVDVDFPGMF